MVVVMSFKITITETREVKKIIQPDYQKIGEKEVLREESFYVRDSKESKTRIESVLGYPPSIEKIVSVERQVLIQEVEDMDIGRVLKAINNL